MNYKMLVKQCKAREGNVWQFGCPWLRMWYDEATQNCTIVGRIWNQRKVWITSEPKFVVRPDNTAVFPNGDLSGVLLGTLGIAGRFSYNIKNVFSRLTYLHNCSDRYEAQPGLVISFSTGKPLNAVRYDELSYVVNKKKHVDDVIATLKSRYLVVPRLMGVKFTRDYQAIPEWTKDDDNCVTALIKMIDSKALDSQVITGILRKVAVRQKYKHNEEDNRRFEPSFLFDRMMIYHQSAVYRHFGAIA